MYKASFSYEFWAKNVNTKDRAIPKLIKIWFRDPVALNNSRGEYYRIYMGTRTELIPELIPIINLPIIDKKIMTAHFQKVHSLKIL